MSPRVVRTACAAALVPALLLLTGCGGSSGGATAAASPAASAAPSPSAARPFPSCRPVPTKAYRWPNPVPADFPRLPGVTLRDTKQTQDGLTIVRFSTSSSLRDDVLFIVRRLPPAGYVLGRGDAEQNEADAPFSKGDLRGVLRGVSREICATEWLLAVTRGQPGGGTGNPLLPAHTGPSPSPLPFG